MMRFYPFFLSVIGILGLATTMVFVVGVVLSFLPGHQSIAHFFVGRSDLEQSFTFLLAAIPYVLIVAHVYLRTHAGALFMKKGLVGDAIAYCEARLKVTPGRGHKEVAYHRLYLAQALAREANYKAALATLDGVERCPATLAGEYAMWELECALRHEDLVRANAIMERIAVTHNKRLKLDGNLRLCAVAAELALRQNQKERFTELMEKARWIEGNPALLDVRDPRLSATVLLAGEKGFVDVAAQGGALLDRTSDWTMTLPGAHLELLLAAGIDPDDGRFQAALSTADARSKYLFQHMENPHEPDNRTDSEHL